MTDKKKNNQFIRIEKITKKFGDFFANNSISLEIEKGKIHALLGENGAGKSTLVKILYGILKPTEGNIFINGIKVDISNPKVARSYGIGMVFQHFSLFPALNVIENILISIDDKISYEDLKKNIINVSKEWGLHINPLKLVGELSVGEQQRVEIIRCLLQNPKLLIMDEPTSVLSVQETQNLFKVLRSLSDSGCAILYISHKLPEIKQLAQKVTILKEGINIDTKLVNKVSIDELAEKMVGEKITKFIGKSSKTKSKSKTIYSVKNLNREKINNFGVSLNNINFEVKTGEIFGIAGIAGNGQIELMEALSGETKGLKKEIIFKNIPIGNLSIEERRNLGIEFIPEERNNHATVSNLNLVENTFLTFYGYYKKNLSIFKQILLCPEISKDDTKNIIDDNDVRTPKENPIANQLSGGNLQKFILGRTFKLNPEFVIISQPTWGVDIGATTSIRKKILELAKTGKSIILISQDLDEIFQLSDRISVINNGNLSLPENKEALSARKIGLLMGNA